jgi:hypothetical protein
MRRPPILAVVAVFQIKASAAWQPHEQKLVLTLTAMPPTPFEVGVEVCRKLMHSLDPNLAGVRHLVAGCDGDGLLTLLSRRVVALPIVG